MQSFQKVMFSIEMLKGTQFSGYTDGQTWNGWACPYFHHDIARAILIASEQNGYRWGFDAKNDSFFVSHKEDPDDFEPERFLAVETTVDGRVITFYAIGAYSWSWEICSER